MDQPSRMPRVLDLSVEQAEQALRSAGLAFAIHHAQSKVVPEGELIGASPPPDSDLYDGTEIVLTVSTGPPRER